MAQDVISTLFNTTPRNAGWNQYMQDNMIDVNRAGSQYQDLGRANIERANAMMQNAGTGLGIGIARLLGGMTPQMAQEQQVQGLLGGASFQDPDQLMMASERFAQAGDIPRAQALAGQAQALKTRQEEQARALQKQQQDALVAQEEVRKKRADALKAEEATQLEKQLRAELAALPPDATPEQVEGVVLKYGDPDKILGILQKRQDKELTLKAQEEAAKQRHLERLEIARENNATRAQIAAMNQQYRQDVLDLRREMGQTKKDSKVLPASLQKAEDEDYAAIDTAQGVVEGIKPIIKSLNDGSLNLSGAGNLLFKAKAAIGSSDPEILQYQALERNLNRFVNESLRLNAGVQTDGDAQRAANEYQAAFSKNNTKAMAASLNELKTINERAIKNRQNQINRRRKSQGISTPANASDVLSEADAILGLN